MGFGENLQYLRKMMNKMTQEELAEKIGVSRQTVSKWEVNAAYPEMNKLIELCELFSCNMDQLVREDMNVNDEAYSNIRVEEKAPFDYIRYTVISTDPETDAINRMNTLAQNLGIKPNIIGWDFPFLSQEQINVYNMHGYTAALILDGEPSEDLKPQVIHQNKQCYIAITIKQPFDAPFTIIPNAYKTLMTHMQVNGIAHKCDKKIIECFEKEYTADGIDCMDIYIAIE
ncbi:MAG: helix-turn-helix transcriptional regulator [Oscillospiraceae bacterium]|nr:helix-turn-helix transcriptional regulator [Oscillospiraceae bacterium]